LIRVFRIYLVGEPLIFGEGTREVGFYRNEYVASSSEERAVAAAKAKTMKKLERSGARFIEGKPMNLQVEKVEDGMAPWRLFRNEGFIIFDVDS